MGDALAIALLETRGFTAKDFARSHPGGTLGKRLILQVSTVMHRGTAIPKVKKDVLLSKALLEITQKHLGMTTIINDDGSLAGVFTDGDLRRILDKNINIQTTPISQVMTTSCKTIAADILAFEALQLMEEFKITSLVVTENKKIIGVVHMHDLLQAGLK
jgi:arabinose-5-phosphate isomerase